MAILEGKKFADERLLDSAGHILHAYYKAPQVSGRLDAKAVVVYGEELNPMLELIEKMDAKLEGAAKELFFPLYVDYQCVKQAIEKGYSPIMVILGADCAKANMSWDCGACGFPTCNEFNRYCKDNSSMGLAAVGPNCVWKGLDYGIACDYACAAAGELNVENRILSTFGLISSLLGYLDGTTNNLGLALGPSKEMWWYSRPSLAKWLDRDLYEGMMQKNYTNFFQMFSTKLNPRVKKDGAWWDEEPEISVAIQPDDDYAERQAEIQGVIMESVIEVRPQVEEMKEKLAKRTAVLDEKN